MKRYWTADMHYGHANIAKYCKRPWLRKADLNPNGTWVSQDAAINCATRMNEGLTKRFNGRVKTDDTVIHVGDFMNYGKVRGVDGLRHKPRNYINDLNGTWVLLKGNHDPNNHIKAAADYMIAQIGHYRVFVGHYPTDSHIYDPLLMDWVYKGCAFAICGHVHEKWHHQWVIDKEKHPPFLNVNVGVDVRKWIPIDDSEVITIYEKAKRQLQGK